jgi:hypothetical protein
MHARRSSVKSDLTRGGWRRVLSGTCTNLRCGRSWKRILWSGDGPVVVGGLVGGRGRALGGGGSSPRLRLMPMDA